MNRFVLDCSLAMRWVFEDENDPEAEAVYAAIRRGGIHVDVPALFWPEVANTLLVAERGGRCAPGKAADFLQNVLTLPIHIDTCGISTLIQSIQTLAKQRALTVYDACYLELAIRLQVPLATRDRALRTASQTAGVELLPAS